MLRRPFRSLSAVVAVAASLFVLVSPPAIASVSKARLTSSATRAAEVLRWTAMYDGGATTDVVADAATSPDGTKVFVTGGSSPGDCCESYATVAYDAVTGAQLWAVKYGHNQTYGGTRVVPSPDGSSVFVTGEEQDLSSNYHMTTIAYDAATGAQRWVAVSAYEGGDGLAVSRDGQTVFAGGSGDVEAYDAATGAMRWQSKGPFGIVRLATGSGMVFATGTSKSYTDYQTMAYAAGTGTIRWRRAYDGPAHGSDEPTAISAAPDGGTVFVTGISDGVTTHEDYATVAYDATTGGRRWVRRYSRTSTSQDEARDIAVASGGSTVVVTGSSGLANPDFVTVAYDARTGSRSWVRAYDGPASGLDYGYDIGVAPDGSTVYVAGSSKGVTTGQDFATIAYGASSGLVEWVMRYRAHADTRSGPSIATGPSAGDVYVAGTGGGYNYLTVAYGSA
jgi:PQQ-like domain